jgi:hypothetical protein
MHDRRIRSATIGLPLVLLIGLLMGARSSTVDPDLSRKEDSVSERETVVLLHGLGRSARNMLILKWRLQARGYRVCNVDYDTRVRVLDEAVGVVAQAVADCVRPHSRIHFVTHSLGGIVLRGLLAHHEFPLAGRAVMLAPPNSGSEIADHFRGIRVVETVLGPLASQLGTRPGDLPSRLPSPSIPFGVIAGNQWINPAGPIWLPPAHDGTVSIESTRLAGMDDHLVLPYSHTFIMNPSVVANQIDHFLRDGRFFRVGDTSTSEAR